MKLFVRNVVIAFCVLLQTNLFSRDIHNSSLQLVTSAVAQHNVSSLPSLQSVENNNQVVNAIVTSQILQDSAATNLTIHGDVEFSGNNLRITVYQSINKIHASGQVVITIPQHGNLQVYVSGVPYHGPIPGLTVLQSNDDHLFHINCSLSIIGSLTTNSLAQATVSGSLFVTPSCTRLDHVSLQEGSSFVVGQDIVLDGNNQAWVCNSGTIESISGNIVMRNHVANNANAIFNSGTISAGQHKSITFENNISYRYRGVYSNGGTIQAGVINLLHNQGVISGVTISSDVYVHNLTISADCSQDNQSSFFTTTIYEFDNHAVPLPSSAIQINNTQNCAIGGGSLVTAGSISITGDVITIANPVTITGLVIINVPISGDVIINGSSYDGSIPGFMVTKNQTNNNFLINAQISATTLSVNGSAIISSGLLATGGVTVSAGSLTVSDYALNCNIGADVTVTSGAAFTIGIGINDCALGGNIVGAGAAIALNSSVEFTGTISAQSLNIADNVTTTSAVTVQGGSLVIAQSKTFSTGGLTHDGLSNVDTYFAANGATLIATTGNIFIQHMNNSQGDGVATGTITASSGNVTISYNQSQTTYSSGVFICGSIRAINIIIDHNSGNNGIYVYLFDPQITATGSLSMSNNHGYSQQSGNGIFIWGNVVLNVGSGGIVMNNNSSDGASGIYQGDASKIATTGNITMNNNNGYMYGVWIVSGQIQTNGTCTIQVDDIAAQNFDASAVTITNVSDEPTAQPFSDFIITVGETVQTAYPTLNNRVLLAKDNQ